jgi:hypothetical protein
MKLNQIWHCPRPALAKSYLSLLQAGPVVSTTIFAPRRTGKTVFLRQDLTPAAEKAGFLVAYSDLWQTRLSPGIALIRGLEEALEPKTLTQKAWTKLQEPVKKVKAKGDLGGLKGELEVELADPKKEATDMALRIEELIGKLVTKKPLLLLVDEAQELARTRENELIATALRTALAKHRDRMRVVFTGSSRSQLSHVFSNTDAPLYTVGGGAVQDFPLLGRELIEFVAKKFFSSTRRALDADALWNAFQGFHQQPEPLLEAVVTMMMDPSISLAKACALERANQDRDENHESTWASLDDLQRHLVELFADKPTAKPFSTEVRKRLAKAMGLNAIESVTIQYALRRLAEKTIVAKSARNLYVFESDAFERWVKTMAAVPRAKNLTRKK